MITLVVKFTWRYNYFGGDSWLLSGAVASYSYGAVAGAGVEGLGLVSRAGAEASAE